ncbi:hypothetical protein CsSME_00007396 [Camellia sinensis var. sinensis]
MTVVPLDSVGKGWQVLSVSAVAQKELDFSSVIKSAKPPRLSILSKEPGCPSRPDVSPVERPSPFVISIFAGFETNTLFARSDWFFGSKEDQEPGSLQSFSVLQEEEEHQEQREV